MKITLTVETSRYSTNPTTRWEYGTEMYVEDIEIEVPDGTDVDLLEDWELIELSEAYAEGNNSMQYLFTHAQLMKFIENVVNGFMEQTSLYEKSPEEALIAVQAEMFDGIREEQDLDVEPSVILIVTPTGEENESRTDSR